MHFFKLIAGGLIPLLLGLSGCCEVAWQAAQLPALRGLNERMNDRAFIRRVSGDPQSEVTSNAKNGYFGFLGMEDMETKKQKVPGLRADQYTIYQVAWYPMKAGEERTYLAESYFKRYNLLMLQRRQGKKFDVYGNEIKS